MKRNKSGLIQPEPGPIWIEPDTGPRSATCFCRKMERRDKAIAARQELYKAAYGPEQGNDVAKFADWKIDSQKALDDLYGQMAAKIGHGATFRVRVQVTG